MNATRASIEKFTRDLLPIQVDGIPEGFSFAKEGKTIGGVTYADSYVAFVPLQEIEPITAQTIEELLIKYNNAKKNTQRR